MRRKSIGLTALHLLLCSISATAGTDVPLQRPFQPLTQVALPHQTIYAMVQDQTGYLWFGTAAGLARYNGHELETWHHDAANPDSLPHDTVFSLVEDSDGRLWIGTAAGLVVLSADRTRSRRVELDPARASPRVRALRAGRGSIWAATSAGVYRVDSGAASRIGSGRLQVYDVDLYGRDRLLILAHEPGSPGVEAMALGTDGSILSRRPVPTASQGSPRIGRAPDGQLWINAHGPLAPDWTPRDSLPAPVTGAVFHDIAFAGGTRTLIGTLDGICAVDEADRSCRWIRVAEPDRFLANEIRSLLVLDTGAIWTGTHAGAFSSDPARPAFEFLNAGALGFETGSGDVSVASVLAEESGVLWVGSYGSGLARLAGDRSARFSRPPERRAGTARSNVIWSLAARADTEGIWVGGYDGIFHADADGLHPIGLSGIRPSSFVVVDLAVDAAGTLWAAISGELYAHDPVQNRFEWHDVRPAGEPGGSHTLNVIRPVEDGLWIGFVQHVVHYHPDTGASRRFLLSEPGASAVAGDGIWWIEPWREYLYIGSSGGLHRLDPRSGELIHFTRADGLPASIVYAMAAEASGRLWLSTESGLVRFDPVKNRFQSYGPEDGTGNREYNRRAVARTAAGEIIFGGMRGLTRFLPADIEQNAHPPRIVIESMTVHGRDGERKLQGTTLDDVRLEPDETSLTLDFAALDYAVPEENRYRYRLWPLEPNWVDGGHQPTARYTSLPPGEYRFEVKAANNDQVWSTSPASLGFVVLPPFWRTWWFATLVGLALIAAAVFGHRYRVARLLELERLRLRIASDLHDDVGSDLSAVGLVTADLVDRETFSAEDRKRLAAASRVAGRTSERLRDIVWLTRPEHDSLHATVRRMRQVAAGLLAHVDLDFRVSIGRDRTLSMDARRNLLLVFKELMHNIARHAEAKHVTVTIVADDDRLTLRVQDDGVGLSANRPSAGDGLANIRRRVDEMDGKLEMDIPADGGTRTTVEISLVRSGKMA